MLLCQPSQKAGILRGIEDTCIIPLNPPPQWGSSGAVTDKEQVQGHCMIKSQSLTLTSGLNTEPMFFPLYQWFSDFGVMRITWRDF